MQASHVLDDCVVARCVCGLPSNIRIHTCSVFSSLPLHHSIAIHAFLATPQLQSSTSWLLCPSHILVSLWHKPVCIAPIPHSCVPVAQTRCTTPVAMHVSLWHKPVALLPLHCLSITSCLMTPHHFKSASTHPSTSCMLALHVQHL